MEISDVGYCTCINAHEFSFNLDRKSITFNSYVKELMESNDRLLEATKQIEQLIIRDPRVADLKADVVVRLLNILNEIETDSVKASAACILSHARFDNWAGVMNGKPIQVLVKLISSNCCDIVIQALKTLTYIAYVSPNHASVIIDEDALESVCKVVNTTDLSSQMIDNLGKFLLVVCRVEFPDNKVQVALTILNKLLQVELGTFHHIVRVCYALSYLSLRRHVKFEKDACKRLVVLITHPNNTVAVSALGVLKNIVKSGKSCQIQILIQDCEFLQCLERSAICCKPILFQKEAFEIISELAARGETSIKDMHEAGLIDTLSKLLELELDDFNIKMAVCETFYAICGYK